MLTLTDLLAIEEDLQVLEFVFEHDDFLMWPLIRAFVLLEALYAEYELKNAHAHSERLSLRDLASYVATTVRENPFKDASPRSIVMFSSGITNVKRADAYFNRLYDHLALEHWQDTLIIEDSVRRRYLRPRRFQPVRSHDWIHIQGVLGARLTRLSSRDRSNIGGLIRYLRANFPHKFAPLFWDAAQTMLIERGKRLSRQHKCYDALFDRLQPRIIFVEDGSYGVRSHIFKWAQARGIATAELQHGLISLNHPAYNYASAITQSARYRPYLPEFLLTCGRYWSEQVRMPSPPLVLGNPNLSEYTKDVGAMPSENGKTVILIVSGGGVPHLLNDITLGLRRLLPPSRYDIVFRPHPGEMPFVKERYGQLGQLRIRVDLSTDLYESICQSHVVAGEMSTALFEALAFAKSVFALDNEYGRLQFTGGLFPRFKDAKELGELVAEKSNGRNPDVEYIWESDWRSRYSEFISNVKSGQPICSAVELAKSSTGGKG
jgi:hypothetical protein